MSFEETINEGIMRARAACSESLDPINQGQELAGAIESLLIALALAEGCELKPECSRHSASAIPNPIRDRRHID